jgi:hypothetical protein
MKGKNPPFDSRFVEGHYVVPKSFMQALGFWAKDIPLGHSALRIL